MSSSSTKSLLFGVFASAMIASFALASENAHVLLHQVRAFRFRFFLLLLLHRKSLLERELDPILLSFPRDLNLFASLVALSSLLRFWFHVQTLTTRSCFPLFLSLSLRVCVTVCIYYNKKQTVSKDAFVQGENVTVAVTATNAGLANARNVVIKAPSNRNGGKWTQVNEESLETKLTSLDVGETKEMTYVYNVKDAGTYTVEPVAIQYFASETREVTKGESNVVKNVKVLTPMQNNARKVLRVTGFFSLGALNTVEDWVKFSKWIAGTIALFLLNWVALKIKYGVQSLRRMAAVRGLEGDAKLE